MDYNYSARQLGKSAQTAEHILKLLKIREQNKEKRPLRVLAYKKENLERALTLLDSNWRTLNIEILELQNVDNNKRERSLGTHGLLQGKSWLASWLEERQNPFRSGSPLQSKEIPDYSSD